MYTYISAILMYTYISAILMYTYISAILMYTYISAILMYTQEHCQNILNPHITRYGEKRKIHNRVKHSHIWPLHISITRNIYFVDI